MDAVFLESIQIELAEGLELLLWHESVSEPDSGFDVVTKSRPSALLPGEKSPGRCSDCL